ncbi:MAG TPA: metallophosphoesterase [Opitutaceae bacterium]|jgi:predicted phosphodiesterase|nr:metallophosphoesterase [Opitutaceae bacterium]
MTTGILRIFSDLHIGDRGCRVRALAQLTPLFDGADVLVFNGDSLDTRPGPVHLPAAALAAVNAATAVQRAGFLDFLAHHAPPTTLLTGNHDPDISTQHSLDLANGQVFVTHGDLFFDNIVPWSRDRPIIRKLLARELAQHAPTEHMQLESRLATFRRVCAGVPQRHHSERNPFRYTFGVLADIAWPTRTLAILRAWHETPTLAAAFLRTQRPQARFLVMGHTHRPGIAHAPGGLTVINTGSFCVPAANPCVVDITTQKITLRRVVIRGGALRFGETLATFALASAAASPKIVASA